MSTPRQSEDTMSGQDSVQAAPVTPTEALLRPFYECPPDELPLAWAAMIKIAAAEGAKPAVQQSAPQAEVPNTSVPRPPPLTNT